MQLFAVWAVMEAFNLDLPLPAAGLVLVLMNVAIIFPLWPGNIGLLQAAVALPLVQYGVPYGTGFAYGLVLQAVEMSVGVGVGLIFLAREGLSLASLKTMEEQQAADETALVEQEERAERGRAEREVSASSGVNEPSRSAMTSLGRRLGRPVAGHGRDEDVALERDQRRRRSTAVTVAVRGTSRRSAISPNDSPGPNVARISTSPLSIT